MAHHYADGMGAGALTTDDELLVTRLRAGDEAAFTALVTRYHPRLLRLAGTFVRDRAVAEEVVQEAWLAVLTGIDRFEGRSSFRTWLFHIVANRARSIGEREARSVPVEDLGVDRDTGPRFDARGDWVEPPEEWAERAAERDRARELATIARACIECLPDQQRRVVVLRDVEGLGAPEVCALLDLTEGNQRVLLHRARTRIRDALDGAWRER